MGPFGSQGSAATALFASIETGCSALVAVGMCFGVREGEQAFGDVLVSTALVPYDRRNVRPHDTLPYEVDYSTAAWSEASPALLAMLRRAQGTARPYQVHFGALLSGGARIHSTRYRDELVARVPTGDAPIVGGEMEGIRLLAASPPEAPNWVIIKGISDFANDVGGETVKRYRQAACQNAVDY